MAAKHDAKKARANMWVTHQNLARAKSHGSGRPGQWQPKPLPRPAKAPAAAPAPAVSEAPGTDTPAES